MTTATTAREYLEGALFSDLHKDAYGYRPREGQWAAWLAMSVAELEVEHDRMIAHLEAEMEREKIAQAAAVVRFEALVTETIANGAGDRATALRWLLDAEGSWTQGDMGALEYEYGLPFQYLGPLYSDPAEVAHLDRQADEAAYYAAL